MLYRNCASHEGSPYLAVCEKGYLINLHSAVNDCQFSDHMTLLSLCLSHDLKHHTHTHTTGQPKWPLCVTLCQSVQPPSEGTLASYIKLYIILTLALSLVNGKESFNLGQHWPLGETSDMLKSIINMSKTSSKN